MFDSMLEFLTTSPMPEVLLVVGGLIAIVIGFLGKNPKTVVDNIAVALGFIVGAVMILMSFLLATDGGWPFSTFLISLLLGVGLFFRVFRKVKVALILALVIGAFLAYGLYLLELDMTIILIVTLIAMVLLYLLFGFVEFFADLVGGVLSFRPVLIVLGLLAILEAVLLFSNSSITTVTGL